MTVRRARLGSLATAVALLCSGTSCAGRTPRAPEDLREEFVRTLPGDDAAAAYALLADEVRAEVPFEEFEQQWKALADERKALAQQAGTVAEDARPGIGRGTTVHEGGRVLAWTEIDGSWYVTEGLPSVARTATPAQTVRALIEAVRSTDFGAISSLLGEELAAQIDEDWQARAEAMERALDRPGSIELSGDLRQAELRYEPGRVLTLEQTPQGWRITSLE